MAAVMSDGEEPPVDMYEEAWSERIRLATHRREKTMTHEEFAGKVEEIRARLLPEFDAVASPQTWGGPHGDRVDYSASIIGPHSGGVVASSHYRATPEESLSLLEKAARAYIAQRGPQ